MLIAVAETPLYFARASKIMTEDEMSSVVDMVSRDPKAGVVIRGTRGLRKMRIPLSGRGKRGGGRVIYWYYTDDHPATLLWAFAKNDQSDLTKQQLAALMAYVDGL